MIISLRQAQSFIVESQLLSLRPPVGKEGAKKVIEQLGYIQIDTISVVSRAHHHVLWSRVKNYQEAHLQNLEAEKLVFEYWAHAASYLPMKDYRYSLVPKQKILKGPGHWRPRDMKWTKYVLDRIKAEGALMARDFKKDPKLNESHAWGGHPVTQALRQLFMEGQIMISGRQGFQKIYDLTERVLSKDIDRIIPSKLEYYSYLIKRDVRAQGLMRATEIGHLISIPRIDLQRLLGQLIEKGELLEIKIKGFDAAPLYALADQYFNFQSHRRKKKLHILSPFDNLIIQRKRLKELFDFEYVLECYVPAPKRKVGYFVLPILWGNQFVGQIDLKADRQKKVLIIRNLVWEENVKKKELIVAALKVALKKYASFNKCDQIVFGPGIQSGEQFEL